MSSSREKTTTTQSQQSQTTPQMLPEQRRQIALNLQRQEQSQSGLLDLDRLLLDTSRTLLSGQQLPGQLSTLGQGIPEDVQQDIIQKSLRDIAPQFERLGVLSSGPAAQISANLARDIRINSEQEKIRQRENLLNAALGFPLSAQSGIAQSGQTLAQQLAGLTPVSSTGTGTTTALGPTAGQRFVGNFASSLGQRMGSPQFSVGPFSFGG